MPDSKYSPGEEGYCAEHLVTQEWLRGRIREPGICFPKRGVRNELKNSRLLALRSKPGLHSESRDSPRNLARRGSFSQKEGTLSRISRRKEPKSHLQPDGLRSAGGESPDRNPT